MTQIQTTLVSSAPVTSSSSHFDRIWLAVIILGLVLNIAWIALLGYGLASILGIAF